MPALRQTRSASGAAAASCCMAIGSATSRRSGAGQQRPRTLSAVNRPHHPHPHDRRHAVAVGGLNEDDLSAIGSTTRPDTHEAQRRARAARGRTDRNSRSGWAMAAAGQSGSTPTPADGDPVPPTVPEQLATRCSASAPATATPSLSQLLQSASRSAAEQPLNSARGTVAVAASAARNLEDLMTTQGPPGATTRPAPAVTRSTRSFDGGDATA